MKNATLTEITGTRNFEQSWEKQTIFDLSNGCSVTVGWNHFYGEFVTRIDDASGYWHCSNGLKTLPARFGFALTWLEKETDLIRVRFPHN